MLTGKSSEEMLLFENVSVPGILSIDVGGRKNRKYIKPIMTEVIKVNFLGRFE